MRQWLHDKYRRRNQNVKQRHGDKGAGPRKPVQEPIEHEVNEDDYLEDILLDEQVVEDLYPFPIEDYIFDEDDFEDCEPGEYLGCL